MIFSAFDFLFHRNRKQNKKSSIVTRGSCDTTVPPRQAYHDSLAKTSPSVGSSYSLSTGRRLSNSRLNASNNGNGSGSGNGVPTYVDVPYAAGHYYDDSNIVNNYATMYNATGCYDSANGGYATIADFSVGGHRRKEADRHPLASMVQKTQHFNTITTNDNNSLNNSYNYNDYYQQQQQHQQLLQLNSTAPYTSYGFHQHQRHSVVPLHYYGNSNNNDILSSSSAKSHNGFVQESATLASSLYPNGRQVSCPGSLKRIKSSTMTAQQASYEAMRTIDLHLIRQIAKNCMDFDLEQKVDLEIKLREVASQSLLEARNEIDLLEVEKSLLTSDQRMNCYTIQLEAQRKKLSNPSLSSDSGRGSRTNSHRRVKSTSAAVAPTSKSSSNNHIKASPNNSSTDIIVASATTEGTSPSDLASSKSQSPMSPVSGQSSASPATTLRRRRSANSTANLSAEQRAKIKLRQQLVNSITTLSNINCNVVHNNKAEVCVSEIRIPLLWRDSDHFKNRGDYKRFAMFCVLKINSQIFDTQLISDVDRQVTDVTFDDAIVFRNIEHDFQLKLELYSCVYIEQFSLSSAPRKIKQRLTNSLSKAVGRRLSSQITSANYIKELEAYDKSYRFAKIATADLSLTDASNSVKTYDLNLTTQSAHNKYSKYNPNNNYSNHENQDKDLTTRNTPPLFGHFCCKLSVWPDVYDKNIRTGYLKVVAITESKSNDVTPNALDNDTNLTTSGNAGAISPQSVSLRLRAAALAASPSMSSSSNLYWAVLCNFALQLWPIDRRLSPVIKGKRRFPDPSFKPHLTITIDRYTRLLRVSNSSVTLETNRACYILSEYTDPEGEEDLASLLRSIEQYIYDSHTWSKVLNHRIPSSNLKQQ